MKAFATLSNVFAMLVILCASSAQGETELSLYRFSGGSGSSQVNLNDPGGAGALSFGANWNVQDATGLRVTWWSTNGFGWGVDFNNQGISAVDDTLAANGLSELALEEGTSLLTLNAFRRWQAPDRSFAPYLGAGLGVAMPQVRFQASGAQTNLRQVTGPAFQFIAGAKYPLRQGVAVFGEYQGHVSVNAADLANGGFLDTAAVGSGINVGISLDF